MLTIRKNTIFSSLKASIKSALNLRFNSWLARRIPKHSQQIINHRNIFIIPTRFGAGLMVFMLLLFLLGTNYQNNVIILISYLLVSFFVVVLLHSFFNLSGLKFQANSALQGFVGDQVYFPLNVSSKKERFNISFSFDQVLNDVNSSEVDNILSANESYNNQPNEVTLTEVAKGDNNIRVPYRICKRGEYSLGRLLIISEFGFGLFKTWTRLDFAQHVTAFPKPVANVWLDKEQSVAGEDVENKTQSYQDSFQPGQDEFHQLQHYKLGEPLSRVAWKHVARGQGWFTKQYQQALSGKLQLDFSQLPAGTIEQRLSWLSYAVKDCSEKQIPFSLTLAEHTVEFDHSAQHTLKCLAALARY